jgi:hypothetical protein
MAHYFLTFLLVVQALHLAFGLLHKPIHHWLYWREYTQRVKAGLIPPGSYEHFDIYRAEHRQ